MTSRLVYGINFYKISAFGQLLRVSACFPWSKIRSIMIVLFLCNAMHFVFQAFVLFHVMFKLLGVKAFQKLTLVHNLASTVRKAMYHHFELITKAMTK